MPVVSVKAFAPLMRQRCTVAPYTGADAYGKPTWGTAVTFQCAVVGEQKLVRDSKGQQVPSRSTVYLMSAASVGPQDKVTLSTGDVGSTESIMTSPPIVSAGRYPFTAGMFATVISI